MANGLVVQAPDGSEFVWIPVEDVVYNSGATISQSYTPMTELQSGSTENYQGMLYEFDGTTSKYQSSYKVGSTNYREPTLITGNNSDTSAILSNIAGSAYDASAGYYNTILGYNTAQAYGKRFTKSIQFNGKKCFKIWGFYIARYELGLENNTPVSKNANANSNVKTATANNSNTYRWYGLYKTCKTYSKENVTSSMIWGSQYDAVMNWMAKQGIDVGSKNENRTNKTEITGKYITDVLNNIYDLYGAHKEWTIEEIQITNVQLVEVFMMEYIHLQIVIAIIIYYQIKQGGGNNTRITLYVN